MTGMAKMPPRSPLENLQDRLLSVVRQWGANIHRDDLDALMVRAFDAGIAAAKELVAETALLDPTAFYVVSYQRDRIESTEEDDSLTHYQTAEEAGDGILNGFHGEVGTRYVLRVKTSVDRVYDRGWTIVRPTD